MLTMFLDNKYSKWYFSIIEKAKPRQLTGYFEKHHIIPLSIGGEDTDSNLVDLTAREHFVCHALLVKMASNFNIRCKMAHAWWFFQGNQQHRELKITSRVYEIMKKYKSQSMKGKKLSEETIAKIKAKTTGRKRTEEQKQNIKNGLKLYFESNPEVREIRSEKAKLGHAKMSDETKAIRHIKMSEKAKARPPMSEETKAKCAVFHRGKPRSEEVKQKIRDSWEGRDLSNYKCSEEVKEKLRIASSGKKHSEEAKEKCRAAHLGKQLSVETKQKLREINLGKKMSEEVKQKISASLKGKHKKTTKIWTILSEQGDQFEIENLSRFCKEQSIPYKSFRTHTNSKFFNGFMVISSRDRSK